MLTGSFPLRNILEYIYYIYNSYRAGDKIKKNKMGWVCGAYG